MYALIAIVLTLGAASEQKEFRYAEGMGTEGVCQAQAKRSQVELEYYLLTTIGAVEGVDYQVRFECRLEKDA